ncbi:AAA family ATPase [Plantactinospora sp. S1510]|uniref:AAA family ATPase n=1 Tax=Plantactinospora alkalitolerans TaxID=2789879 RepID=A0ABS0H3R9_9ACTN|nr:AAA family ATPase [Plantactinospora alkalitolerans]MBF9132974.1 AAA family ATPase [Plantactinospora alkalitolerans]
MAPPTSAHPTAPSDPAAALAEEQARLASARKALARMLDTARLRVATGASVAGDRYTAETLGRMLKSHVKELAEEPDGPLYFGRLWFGDSPAAGEHRHERYYLGRRHITDESGQPVVIDWRAPISRAFYRASTRDPLGVRERRRYGWTGRHPAELTGFEDEILDGGASTDGTSRLVAGASADATSRLVAAEIERPRVGPMRDIVATIQPEQDDLVRADLDRSVCVQGGPGSGKTAVGLHRAAYLLYTHRRQMKRGGVLVVGPNPAFLRYISAVLPALGEVDVEQQTLAELVGGNPVGATDSEAAARVKHDPRMATVLHRALYHRTGEPTGPLVVPDGSYQWRVPVGWLRRIFTEVRAEALPYAIGRERLRSRVVGLLQRRAETRTQTPSGAWLRRMARCRPVTTFLDEAWPATRPEELLALLFGDPAALARASAGLLEVDEQAVLRWPPGRPRTARTATWSAADRVLLDEVAGLLDHPAGYRHIVVDEAQDLSPMQCRAVARRSRHGSLTVLGDLAQGTTPWAASDWRDQLAHLGQPDAAVVPLTAGFRVPAVVLELANRLLPELRVVVPPTRSVRTDGMVRIRAAVDLPTATTEAVAAALGYAGSIGVIAADARLPRLVAALRAAGTAVAGPDGDDGVRVTMLPASLAKGLEYDHVIVVEPVEIVEAEPRGPHRLYVVLTRAVSRLDVLHHRALPPALRG